MTKNSKISRIIKYFSETIHAESMRFFMYMLSCFEKFFDVADWAVSIKLHILNYRVKIYQDIKYISGAQKIMYHNLTKVFI
jgi:hypothetical protein